MIAHETLKTNVYSMKALLLCNGRNLAIMLSLLLHFVGNLFTICRLSRKLHRVTCELSPLFVTIHFRVNFRVKEFSISKRVVITLIQPLNSIFQFGFLMFCISYFWLCTE